jgi:uncharacterized protein YhhL (DUF1145 family)
MDAMEQDPLSDPPESRRYSFRGVIREPTFESTLREWLRKFLACNPFYLVSAAMLLYGMYLISADANFAGRENTQLLCNFGSLQFYELLLVATAIFLARRHIWYDSSLLAGLESLLIFVPFLLLNQATLAGPLQAVDGRMVWGFCIAGGVMAVLRFGSLKRFYRELNLPRSLMVCGFLLLLFNLVLPLVYRHFEETRIGARPTDGAAYLMNLASWLVLLPAALALVNTLPAPRSTGNLLPQNRWLPTGLLSLWLLVSGVHVYSLNYVYDLEFKWIFVVPLLWVGAWTGYLRHAQFLGAPAPLLSRLLLISPVAIPFFALAPSSKYVFLTLTLLNLGFECALIWHNRDLRIAAHLLGVSLVGLLAGLTLVFAEPLRGRLAPLDVLVLAAMAYGLYRVIRSRDPRWAILGAILTAWAVATGTDLAGGHELLGIRLAVQSALVFLLLHSLRWDDGKYAGAMILRGLACGAWVLHSLNLVHGGGGSAAALVYTAGGVVLAVSVCMKLYRGTWRPALLPLAAVVVLLGQPGDFAAVRLHTTPAGFVAMMGSLLLFALGTLAALTKSRWNRAPSPAMVPIKPDLTRGKS